MNISKRLEIHEKYKQNQHKLIEDTFAEEKAFMAPSQKVHAKSEQLF